MRHFQLQEFDPGGPFLMTIQDVFNIKHRGTVITGRTKRGAINQGDAVEIIKDGSITITARVSEMNSLMGIDIRAFNPRAQDLCFKDVTRDQIERGMLIAAPGSVGVYRRFRADIYIRTLAESMNKTAIPLEPKNRSRFYIFESERYGQVILPDDVPAVVPGQEMNLLVELNKRMGLIENTVFPLWVDPPGSARKCIGQGRITALID